MKNYNMTLTKKQQNIVLSSGKTDKHEYLTDEEILTCDQSKMIEKGNITYSSLGKVLKNNKNKLEDAGKNKEKRIKHVVEKQTKALQTLNTYPQLK